ncbi:MAG: UbiA family prenyltransferase [Williamsia sp.]|nr:UbiA family prenyltransferase [Williamsia sp.]
MRVRNYFSLVKFSHTVFAMPFAMIGFFLGITYEGAKAFYGYNTPASSRKPFDNMHLLTLFLLVVLCMIFARSAAMGFNRWLDKHFDKLNPRTSVREIPAGIITANNALWFVIINCIAFVICTLFINRLCFYLSFVALAVILGYSYTKRFTPLCHLILGLGLALAPIGAFLAVTAAFDLLPLLFSVAVIFWVSGFDIIYALQDVEFDQSQQLHSIPVMLGAKGALRVSELLHLLSAGCVIAAGLVGHFGILYWAGIGVFVGMLIYQHTLVKINDLSRVNIEFMTANGIASVIFAIFVITDLFVYKFRLMHSFIS